MSRRSGRASSPSRSTSPNRSQGGGYNSYNKPQGGGNNTYNRYQGGGNNTVNVNSGYRGYGYPGYGVGGYALGATTGLLLGSAIGSSSNQGTTTVVEQPQYIPYPYPVQGPYTPIAPGPYNTAPGPYY